MQTHGRPFLLTPRPWLRLLTYAACIALRKLESFYADIHITSDVLISPQTPIFIAPPQISPLPSPPYSFTPEHFYFPQSLGVRWNNGWNKVVIGPCENGFPGPAVAVNGPAPHLSVTALCHFPFMLLWTILYTSLVLQSLWQYMMSLYRSSTHSTLSTLTAFSTAMHCVLRCFSASLHPYCSSKNRTLQYVQITSANITQY